MTEYFEIHGRDGAARRGELRLDDPLPTPVLVDDVLEDAGSLWTTERAVPEGSADTLTILPHRALPSGTRAEVADAFSVDPPTVDYPTAVVVSPETAADHGADAYVLSTAQGIVGHGAAFVEATVETRESIPADTALYLPGVATPGNVATLAYAGVDLFDRDRAVVRGTQGWYLTTDGESRLDEMQALPCSCQACQQPIDEFDREDCVGHNVAALEAAIARVREQIRNGRLRDYIEAQARHEQWHTAVFRELDQQWTYLEERTPLVRRTDLTAASGDTIRRVEIQRFAERVTERYSPRFDDRPLVLVPCSARKPYSDSQSHGQFHDAIQFRGHTVSMTSPIGVVPQELELTYPAQHYDTVVTGRWSETEIAFVTDVLTAYLERADYPRVIAHVPEEGYREIVERATDAVGIDPEYTVAEHPTDDESLAALSEALDGEEAYLKRERQHNTVKAIADYMLGDGAGDDLFEDVTLAERYPKLRVDKDGEQLAALVPEYGILSFTLAGARHWIESDAPTKRVEIDDFVPRGSVLAPGIVDADDDIRPGDEVVFEGPEAFCVGRAAMSGPEMVESTRGIASEVRHVQEK
jgi:archaeosine synthase